MDLASLHLPKFSSIHKTLQRVRDLFHCRSCCCERTGDASVVMTEQPHLQATISISPLRVVLGEAAILTVTATLHHNSPITIFTWGTIFDTNLAYTQGFKCTDLTSNAAIAVCRAKKKRAPFSSELGGSDDVYFQTLEPGATTVFKGSFDLAEREHYGEHVLTRGHRYRLEPKDGHLLTSWWHGRKEEVMSPAGQRAPLKEPDRPPILLDGDVQAEYQVSGETTPM